MYTNSFWDLNTICFNVKRKISFLTMTDVSPKRSTFVKRFISSAFCFSLLLDELFSVKIASAFSLNVLPLQIVHVYGNNFTIFYREFIRITITSRSSFLLFVQTTYHSIWNVFPVDKENYPKIYLLIYCFNDRLHLNFLIIKSIHRLSSVLVYEVMVCTRIPKYDVINYL